MRMEHDNPVRGVLDHGLKMIGGGDHPGPLPVEREPNNPMIPFCFFTTRRMANGQVLGLEEKIGRKEPLRLSTVNPACGTFEAARKGQIAPRMLADFVVLNQDLLTVPDDRILATSPLATFVGGHMVHAAAGSKFRTYTSSAGG